MSKRASIVIGAEQEPATKRARIDKTEQRDSFFTALPREMLFLIFEAAESLEDLALTQKALASAFADFVTEKTRRLKHLLIQRLTAHDWLKRDHQICRDRFELVKMRERRDCRVLSIRAIGLHVLERDDWQLLERILTATSIIFAKAGFTTFGSILSDSRVFSLTYDDINAILLHWHAKAPFEFIYAPDMFNITTSIARFIFTRFLGISWSFYGFLSNDGYLLYCYFLEYQQTLRDDCTLLELLERFKKVAIQTNDLPRLQAVTMTLMEFRSAHSLLFLK